MELLSAVLFLLIGLAAGFTIAYFRAQSLISRLEERNENLDAEVSEHKNRHLQEQSRAGEAENELAELKADYRNLKERLEEQKQELENFHRQFEDQFSNLANKILEEKSEKFTKQNKEQLDLLLDPLGKKLEEFKKKVEDTYEKETRERTSLKEQIRQMAELNQKMTDEAKNLTKALKGESKTQGSWGEMILQRILEKSGLSKGREYEVQESVTTEEGRRLQPDVVVHLPDDKHLVIDSKVSLTAYERMISAEEEVDQQRALKQHIASLRSHVKRLSSKDYQQIYAHNSPDFVLMFVPVESAFGIALQNDTELYYEAFEKNIVIVSPSTLLATLATIDSVWKQEYQNKNALEIAERGGALYDKFVLFVESMHDIGMRIEQTQKSYEEAMGRLETGRGSLTRQAEMLRELGAKAAKKLPERLSGLPELEEEPADEDQF